MCLVSHVVNDRAVRPIEGFAARDSSTSAIHSISRLGRSQKLAQLDPVTVAVIASVRVRASSPSTHKVYYGCSGRATQTMAAERFTLTGLVIGSAFAADLLADF